MLRTVVPAAPQDDVARTDGALWMVDQALSLVRSSSRTRELLDASAGVLEALGMAEGGWALHVVTHDLTGRQDVVVEALAEGLSARPDTCWAALATLTAVAATLHDEAGARAWLRARRPW